MFIRHDFSNAVSHTLHREVHKMFLPSQYCISLPRHALIMTLSFTLAVLGLNPPDAAHAGIVAFWDFSENGGSTLGDVSTNDLDGIIYGSPSWVAGHLGGTYGDYALEFTGNPAQYVHILDNALLHIGAGKTPFTLALWAQDSGSSWGEAFCFGTGARNFFWQENGGNTGWLQSQIWQGYTVLNLAGGGWHHIGMSYNGTNILIYKDAVLVETRGAGTQTVWGDLYIGRHSCCVTQPWNGKLSDLIILDLAADVTEVGQIMNGTYPGMPELPLPPVDGTWTNPASGEDWSDPANWASGTVASIGNADFSTIDIPADNTVHLDAPYRIQSLTFGDADTNTAAGWILDNNGDATNVLTLTGSITVTNLGAGAQVTISATVTGKNGLVKSGPGALVVSTNTYSGNTTVNGGSLTVYQLPANSGLSFGGGILEYAGNSAPGGTFAVSGTENFYLNVTGAGDLEINRPNANYIPLYKAGTGTVTLANGNADSGDLYVNGGTAVLSGTSNDDHGWYNNVGAIKAVVPGTTVQLGNSNRSQVYYDYAFHMSGGIFDVNGQNPTAGNQTWSLPAIDGTGTISNSAAGTTGTPRFKITGTRTFSGNILDGTGSARVAITLAQSGGATPTWILSGTNTYSGATTVNSGTFQAGSSSAFPSNSAYMLASGATLDLAGHDNAIGSLTGADNVTLGGATLAIGFDNITPAAFAGVVSGTGSVVKAGSGTLTFSGANTYTGDTTVVDGMLSIAMPSLSPTNDVYLATGARLDLDFTGTNTIRSWHLNGRMRPSGTWGASGSGATSVDDDVFSGAGVLLVTIGPFSGSSIVVR